MEAAETDIETMRKRREQMERQGQKEQRGWKMGKGEVKGPARKKREGEKGKLEFT